MTGRLAVDYYDGSSTDSEPFDDGEYHAPPPQASAAAPRIKTSPKRKPPALSAVSAAAGTHSVLNLAPHPLRSSPSPLRLFPEAERPSTPVVPPNIEIKQDVQADASSSTTGQSERTEDTASHAAPASNGEAATTCGNCKKATLSEAARLTPGLVGQETIYCHCCGLALPSFCFTAPQRAASNPECRGCRGVPAVIATLTTRIKKLLTEQQQGSSASSAATRTSLSPAVQASSTAVVPPTTVANQREGSSPTGSRVESTDDTTENAPTPDSETTCGKCSKVMLSEAARLTTQLVGQETYYCHCCKLALVSFCLTAPQRSAHKPVCRGCRGAQSVVASLTSRVEKLLNEQQQQQASGTSATTDASPVATPTAPAAATSRKQAPCELCQLPLARVTAAQARAEGKVKFSCCARELPDSFYSNAQLHKAERRRCKGCLGNVGRPSKEKIAAGVNAWKAKHPGKHKKQREADKSGKKKQTNAQKRESEKTAVFRNRVQRYKFSVRALARKRAENDLRGSTQIEYMKELAKEEAALKHQAHLLRQENPTVFRQFMGAKVKRPRLAREDADEEDWSDESDGDANELILNNDAPSRKRRRTGSAPSTPTPPVVDLTSAVSPAGSPTIALGS